MENFALCCTIFGGFILSFGLLSLFIKERLYIAETVVATLYGIVCRIILDRTMKNPTLSSNLSHSTFIYHFAHIVLAIQLVAVGATVPRVFMRKNWRSLLVLLLPVMGIMYAISTIIIKFSCNLGWRMSMVIGACVTPTDPILASTVIKGKFANKYIPSKLRYLLAIESGANDGLGFPLLVLPIFLLKHGSSNSGIREAFWDWFVEVWGFEIFLAIIFGAIIGYFARMLLKYSIKHSLIDKESYLAYTLALAILITGITCLLRSDDLLAVFVSGVVFAWDRDIIEELKDSHVLEVIDLLFNQIFFIIFGMIISEGHILSFKNVLTGFLIVALRRLPAMLIVKMLGMLPKFNTKEVVFAGWFGPIGVGAIFFAHHALIELVKSPDVENTDQILNIVYSVVFISILVHGMTAPIIHLPIRRKHRRRKELENAYESDTEVEKEFEAPNRQQLI
ncbi:sodium/hydrogen antiporter [Nematocida sp. LUAm3]|nr:sodium/hydrogen antiporter [Nematocida sp. LUAm3]KAI5174888.1 sodium/hydrogen antiporter [Nematocida sp. LUAm2]KAI5177514.1 sodium/hydrogen antiporter [Nematocida sp. LUAm1]